MRHALKDAVRKVVMLGSGGLDLIHQGRLESIAFFLGGDLAPNVLEGLEGCLLPQRAPASVGHRRSIINASCLNLVLCAEYTFQAEHIYMLPEMMNITSLTVDEHSIQHVRGDTTISERTFVTFNW